MANLILEYTTEINTWQHHHQNNPLGAIESSIHYTFGLTPPVPNNPNQYHFNTNVIMKYIYSEGVFFHANTETIFLFEEHSD